MSTEVTLPALGESVTEGTISRWLKAVGDTVEADEPLLEVSTDKVDTEIPSPVAGTLLEIKFEEDDVAEVGAVLAIIGDADDAPSDDEPAAAPVAEEAAPDDADDAAEEEPVEVATPEEEPEPEQAHDKPTAAASSSGVEVTLPALGESVTEGTISRWLKEIGDTVEADEPLLEVSTDKVDTEIPSPAAGTLLEIRFKEDDVAEVGAVLAVIGDASAEPEPKEETDPTPAQPEPKEEPKEEPKPKPKEEPKPEPKEEPKPEPKEEAKVEHSPAVEAAVARRAAESSGDGTYVTPLVRKMAKEHGVDLSSVKGTGVGGRIRKQDVLDAAEAAKQAPAEEKKPAAAPAKDEPKKAAAEGSEQVRGTTEKLSRLRKTIASRMVESLQVSAQLTATVEVDVTAISHIRNQVKDDFKKREGASLSYLPFITMAAVEALKAFPIVNATIDTEAGTVTYADGEHVGIAVDTEKGLLVPVIKDAGTLNLTGLAKKIADLAARTRSSKVAPDELSGGTFTITNYGSAGTLFDTPIINQPQVAILGTGALAKRPVVVEDRFGNESIAIRHMMYLSMSYDHRLIDGAMAARFLSAVKERLEDGDFGGELGL
ncbi:2-oxoglutarate dehydrogenase, E2 component, dihydrolipoamide succinyltransferase [Tessaracoccus flavus]|uniref:Dihydrolipoamide acetyltransferase component of pyruvate dehydrogenase complex n=1 Tax=Tessaracoccus flavus TaxID=1610493 RepID=A0A1Q2CD33_9ACTN|nr:2-oxoglutarate dehydrogenase, E2 component, dihydrolipoamide succinyltransferase [Tessaracoccus flavus]AQP44006.1 dihydrolipoamide acyltransferase [Tessaracoccus flavus]SDY31854.1 2-oxoglutarate dehydrogenase E2 component [Tessaracoccus flavus]